MHSWKYISINRLESELLLNYMPPIRFGKRKKITEEHFGTQKKKNSRKGDWSASDPLFSSSRNYHCRNNMFSNRKKNEEEKKSTQFFNFAKSV